MAKSYNDLQRKVLLAETAETGSPTETVNDLADARLLSFEREVLSTFGDTIKVSDKAKTLRLLGVNVAASTAKETVWFPGGSETYVTTNAIDTLSSSSASDTDQVIRVEGHTVVGTGLSAVYTFVSQLAPVLTGQTKVVLATPLARVSYIHVHGVGSVPVGDIYVYEDDTITLGVPDTPAKIHQKIEAVHSNGEKAATTLSGTDYMLITHASFGVSKGASASVCDFVIEIREPGENFLHYYQATVSNTNAAYTASIDPGIIVPKNSDVIITATASATIPVSAMFAGYLATVTS